MPHWLYVTLSILTGFYIAGWCIISVIMAIDGCFWQGVHPLSFWRANSRRLYYFAYLSLKVEIIKGRRQQREQAKEIDGEIEKKKQELVTWAFKDPDSFLGTRR